MARTAKEPAAEATERGDPRVVSIDALDDLERSYLAAAGGDVRAALREAIADGLLAIREERARAACVSRGYVFATLRDKLRGATAMAGAAE